MKRKIVGIFVIALLTFSYIPIVSSEMAEVPESHGSESGDIKFFLKGWTTGYSGEFTYYVKQLIASFGVYNDIRWFYIDVIANGYLQVDGKIENIKPPYTLILHNFSGIGTPFSFGIFLVKGIISPFPAAAIRVCFTGSCESYEIKNVTSIAI